MDYPVRWSRSLNRSQVHWGRDSALEPRWPPPPQTVPAVFIHPSLSFSLSLPHHHHQIPEPGDVCYRSKVFFGLSANRESKGSALCALKDSFVQVKVRAVRFSGGWV